MLSIDQKGLISVPLDMAAARAEELAAIAPRTRSVDTKCYAPHHTLGDRDGRSQHDAIKRPKHPVTRIQIYASYALPLRTGTVSRRRAVER